MEGDLIIMPGKKIIFGGIICCVSMIWLMSPPLNKPLDILLLCAALFNLGLFLMGVFETRISPKLPLSPDNDELSDAIIACTKLISMADISIKIVTNSLGKYVWTEEVLSELKKAVKERKVNVSIIFGNDRKINGISYIDPNTLNNLNWAMNSAFLKFYDLKRSAKRHFLITDETCFRIEKPHDESIKVRSAKIIQYNPLASRRLLAAFEKLFKEATLINNKDLFQITYDNNISK